MDPVAKKELGEAMAAAMKDQQLVRGATHVMQVLDRHSLLVRQQLQPDMVGVHDQNRDGLGLHALDVLDLITGISQVGWDDAVPSPVCIEVGTRTEIGAFNQQLVSQSNGAIPPYPPGQPRYASIACSHTNACLRAILHGAPGVAGVHDDIMVAGKLNVDLLRSEDPKFAEACQAGLTWRIISQLAVAQFADLPSLIQSASNCTGQLAKGEHEVQLMRRICNTIQVCLKSKKSACFPDVKNQILRSRPACGAAAPFMHRFLIKFSMGATGLWDRVEQILRSSANSGRQLGADFFEALAADPRPATADSCIHLRHAILLAAYTLPVSKLITEADVKRLLSKDMQKKADLSNQLIIKIWNMIDANQSAKKEFRVMQSMARFQTHLVLLLLRKKHDSVQVPSCVEEAACNLMDSIEEAIGTRLSSEWDGSSSTKEAEAESSDSSVQRLVVFQPFWYIS